MKSGVREEENQEKRGWSGRKPSKAKLEQRKSKKSMVRVEKNQEKLG